MLCVKLLSTRLCVKASYWFPPSQPTATTDDRLLRPNPTIACTGLPLTYGHRRSAIYLDKPALTMTSERAMFIGDLVFHLRPWMGLSTDAIVVNKAWLQSLIQSQRYSPN